MRRSLLLISTIGTAAALVVAGCSQSVPLSKSLRSPVAAKPTVKGPQFGPVYAAEDVTDPIVARAIKSRDSKAYPVASAEIRGFLVDWTIRHNNESSIRELVVMKDGTLWSVTGPRGRIGRPDAAFGNMPQPRLRPESVEEARARLTALAAARKKIEKLDGPKFAVSAKPLIFSYLVRVHRTDGSSFDVWIESDGSDGRPLIKLQKAKIEQPPT